MSKNKSYPIKTLLKNSLIGKYEILFSLVFAAILALGHLLVTYVDIDVRDIGTRLAFGYIGTFIITWGIVLFVFALIKRWHLNKSNVSGPVFLGSFSDKKLWLLTSLGIFICYLPLIFMIISVLTPDSWNTMGQITGDVQLSNGNPLIFTALASIFVHIGLLFGSLELGTLFFSLAQSAILAMIFARVIVWMRQEKIGTYGIIATLIFYAILPINAVAGTIMWKDILFAGFALLFLILLRKLYIEKNAFFTRKNVAHFIILAFLFCTLRNNGLYAYVLFFVLILIINYRTIFNIRVLSLLLTPILIAVTYLSLIQLIATPTTASYALMCVPMQQIARAVKYERAALSADDKKTINEILPVDKLAEIYNPNLSDPVMSSFNGKVFDEDKAKYLGLWLKLLSEHPKTFIAATLYNTYGYVYPFRISPTTTDTIMNNSVHPNAFKSYSDSAYVDGNKQAVGAYSATISSLFPVIHNIGFYTFMLLLAIYIAIIRKKRELTAVFVILFALFVSTILGPVNGEFRYLYLFVVALPFVLASVYASNEIKKSRQTKKS
ncbi:MAG: putative rane protein [Candidatus Saccharibacteria bacterium]|nr:putative rane protein [Candidatus Saccharibacteria bacterium]